MGVTMHWFKETKIEIEHCGDNYIIAHVNYINGDFACHAYSSRSKLQDLFYEKCGIYIPTIFEECIDNENYDLGLIPPTDMANYCDQILSDSKYNSHELRERVEWIKSLSLRGFYVAYESE